MTEKILIVEDEAPILKLLVAKFEKEGFEVLQAKNGKEGLRVAKHKHPDVILLDIIMPKMDGVSMLKKIRKDEWGKTAQVIILSNLSEGGEVDEVKEQNIYGFLVKTDWKLSDLIRMVKKAIK